MDKGGYLCNYALFLPIDVTTPLSMRTRSSTTIKMNSPQRATKAATDGIQVAFQYGQPPFQRDKLGQKLQTPLAKDILYNIAPSY